MRLDHHVAADLVSAQRNTVSGAISVAPAGHGARRSRACATASAWASWTRSLTPSTSVFVATTTRVSRPSAAREFDDIGQIKLALGVVVADPFQQRERLRAVDRHQAGVAEPDGALFLARVLLLANRVSRPAASRSRRP